ncbi:asparagine synthase (glutamine-hydrolyzing) [Dietzia sp.]|uniref:asparagine synthase (glutamine-hydrolyzing) n=1 Tax=Dietzia sp. TaxID=1871616 RepID=UPI002FD9298E
MCGLIGLLSHTGNAAAHSGEVLEAMKCMHHRGPDEVGTYDTEDLVFGFNRLAIIDISHSHQPLHWGPADEPDRYTLVFNGEIYNYIELREQLIAEFGAEFATEGDGEPIVVGYHHWGPEVLNHLRGMFGIAIWDSVERTMFVARDFFGIKPMYVAEGPDATIVGSEKKSVAELAGIAGVDTSIDTRALQHYVTLQYVPEPETLNKGIRRIESGTYALFSPSGEAKYVRYFTPTIGAPSTYVNNTGEAAYRRIKEALEDSVAKHMRADVTVGSFLSGGIDSTAIAALARRHNNKLKTFTTGFEREGYSEIDVAAESAAAIGVEHIVKVVSPEEFAAAIPEIIWYLDEPVADPALVPLYFVAKEARKHVKVVLSGEGADEFFGGYTIYKEPLSLAPFEKVPGALRPYLGRISDKLPEGVRGKSLLHRGSKRLEDRYYGNARSFSEAQVESVLRDYHRDWGHQDVTAPIYRLSEGWDPVARMQHVDLFTWLRGDILVKADKITMANSLELRVPFLDKEVFEVARTLPTSEKISHGTTKYALRRAIDEITPQHVINRRKLGFPVPTRHWLAGPELHDWARGIVADSETDHLVDKAAVLRMLDEHRKGVSDHSRRIWTLLCFMIWHGIFVEKRIVPNIERRDYPVKL